MGAYQHCKPQDSDLIGTTQGLYVPGSNHTSKSSIIASFYATDTLYVPFVVAGVGQSLGIVEWSLEVFDGLGTHSPEWVVSDNDGEAHDKFDESEL